MQRFTGYPIEMAEGASPPSEFRIWTWGENPTLKGSILFDDKAAADVMAAYQSHGVELAIDYEHQTFNSADNGQPAPAAGWFKPEVRADGLWATGLRWTADADAYLRARKYRYFSPVASVNPETRRPTKLMPMALTNWPATVDQDPLVARATSQPSEIHMDVNVTALLGLKAEADGVEVSTAINRLRDVERDLLLLSGKPTLTEAFALLTACKEKAGRFDAIDAELSALKADKAKTEITALLDAAVRDGRLRPAGRADFETLAANQGVEALRVCLTHMPKAGAPAIPVAVEPGAPAGFTAEQLKVIRMIGADPVAVAKHRAESPAYRAAAGEDD